MLQKKQKCEEEVVGACCCCRFMSVEQAHLWGNIDPLLPGSRINTEDSFIKSLTVTSEVHLRKILCEVSGGQ